MKGSKLKSEKHCIMQGLVECIGSKSIGAKGSCADKYFIQLFIYLIFNIIQDS
jgi:hypothetical protein